MSDVLTTVLLIYLAVLNIVGFIMMGSDKSRAVKGRWRIPEKAFFLCSAIGGSAGTLAGMYVFHHKTKHWYFVVWIPVIMTAQMILALFLLTGVIRV